MPVYLLKTLCLQSTVGNLFAQIASEAAIGCAVRVRTALYPQVIRIVNGCCPWAENVAYGKPTQSSSYQYLKACLIRAY